MQAYSNPKREGDKWALPDIEVFYAEEGELWTAEEAPSGFPEDGSNEAGWFWWACFPGCLPDSDPFGPFATAAEALADAQDGMED